MAKYSVSKNGKYLKFTCVCGSEMWDNRLKKKNPKAPDLKCKDVGCTIGTNGTPNAVWLQADEVKELGVKYQEVSGKASSGQTSMAKSGSPYKAYNENIPLGMQVAWAKDVAICLAKARKITTSKEFSELYEVCLDAMKDSVDKFLAKHSDVATQEVSREVVDTNLIDTDDSIDEPEDVKEPVVVEKKEEVKEVDAEFDFDCEDIDI